MESYEAVEGNNDTDPPVLSELAARGWYAAREIDSPEGASDDYLYALKTELKILTFFGYDYTFGPSRPHRPNRLTLLIRWRYD